MQIHRYRGQTLSSTSILCHLFFSSYFWKISLKNHFLLPKKNRKKVELSVFGESVESKYVIVEAESQYYYLFAEIYQNFNGNPVEEIAGDMRNLHWKGAKTGKTRLLHASFLFGLHPKLVGGNPDLTLDLKHLSPLQEEILKDRECPDAEAILLLQGEEVVLQLFRNK